MFLGNDKPCDFDGIKLHTDNYVHNRMSALNISCIIPVEHSLYHAKRKVMLLRCLPKIVSFSPYSNFGFALKRVPKL